MKKYLKQLKVNKKGFTLIEMIVVIAIIGILAAILVPSMAGYLSNARESKKQANARTIYTAAQAAVTSLEGTERLENKQYTDDETDIAARTGKTVGSLEKPLTQEDILFDKIFILVGESNYKKFEEIIVEVEDGAVIGVSVTEKGEDEPALYPEGFTTS